MFTTPFLGLRGLGIKKGGRLSKILLYDLETSPLVSYTWGIYDQNVVEVVEDFQILCFAWKWLGDKKINVVAQPDFKEYKPGVNDDFRVVEALWDKFDQADIIIAHNGDSFDQKKTQARMMAHDMEPPSPYAQIDTKKIAKRYANFTSNKLDHLGEALGLGRKLDNGGFETWKGCLVGDKKAWKLMTTYNKQDVALLEQVYLKLRPWISNHPALNVLDGRPESCPKCGSGPLESRGTVKLNKTSIARRFRCKSCGGWSQSRKAEPSQVRYV